MSPALWQAVRILASCGLAEAVSALARFPDGFWAMVTAVVVTQPALDATLSAGRDRVFGTLCGAAVGFAVIEAARTGVPLWPAFWLGLLPLAVLTAFRPNLRLGCITLIVVVLVPSPGGLSLERPLARVGEILVGTLAAVAVSLVVAPWRDRLTRLRRYGTKGRDRAFGSHESCEVDMLEKIPSIVGEALKGVRPGLDKTVGAKEFGDTPETIAVESSAFGHEGKMPAAYTEDGAKRSPPLRWANAPSGTAEVVLIIEDADSPTPEPLVHTLAWGLPAQGELPEGGLAAGAASLGKNSFMKTAYLPPDPPSGHGAHRYVFQVFALGKPSGLTGEPGRGAVVDALKGKVSAKGVLIGTYERG